jgi:hypothetical protein
MHLRTNSTRRAFGAEYNLHQTAELQQSFSHTPTPLPAFEPTPNSSSSIVGIRPRAASPAPSATQSASMFRLGADSQVL